MTDNEIKREQPSFEVRAESLKKRTKEFFSTYENPNGSEDRLEICLIREGYRTVLMAEEEINRQKAEIESLQISHFQFISDINTYKEKLKTAKAEAVKEFAERLHEYINGIIERHEMPMFPFSVAFVSGMETKIDNLVKEMVGEG